MVRFLFNMCVYTPSSNIVVVMPVVVLVLSMEPHYHYKDIIKASKIVTEQLLITIINLILYKKNIQRAVQFLAIIYGDFIENSEITYWLIKK